MPEYFKDKHTIIYNNDCIKQIKEFDSNSIDSIITDPPYEIGFMNAAWDYTGISFDKEIWKECLRVAKPGAFLLCFGGSRTFHRIACAIEDAGWELKDTIIWLYSSGMPKALDIGKAVDEKLGNKREVTQFRTDGRGKWELKMARQKGDTGIGHADGSKQKYFATKGNTEWEGYKSALKPAFEPIIVAMKPIDKTFAENALKWGVAGFNIEECRIPLKNENQPRGSGKRVFKSNKFTEDKIYGNNKQTPSAGRYPANVILDEESAKLLDKQTKEVKNTKPHKVYSKKDKYAGWGSITQKSGGIFNYDEPTLRGASRFFYCAKASTFEREFGLNTKSKLFGQSGGAQQALKNGKNSYQETDEASTGLNVIKHRKNTHPTVKPLALMEFLCKLTRPPSGGVVLDPFMGSGTTGVACKKTGRKFIGIDIYQDWCEVAKLRIKATEIDLF